MKTIQLLFKDDNELITTSVEEIIDNCEMTVNELEVMHVLFQMKADRTIELVKYKR